MDNDAGPIFTMDDDQAAATAAANGATKRKHDDDADEKTGTSAILCCECGTVIHNSSNLVVHVRRHLQYQPYHCSLCNYQGYDSDEVRRHASSDHSGEKFKVNHRSKIDMEARVREIVQKSNVPSTLTANSSSSSLTELVCKTMSPKSYSNSSPASCSESTTLSRLIRQKTEQVCDSNDVSVKPSSIFGQFSNNDATQQQQAQFLLSPQAPDMLSNLFYAALSQMDLDSMKCGLCGESIPHNPVPIIRHLKIHSHFSGYACSLCDTLSKTVNDLELHLLNAHSDELDDDRIRPILINARKSTRQEMTQLVETAFWGLGQMAKIKCNLCSEKILWRASSLSAHLREHVSYYPYKCLMCTAQFVDHSGLLEHFTLRHSNAFVLLNFVADLKADNEMESMFDKCFPALSALFIEDLEPETRRQREVVENLTDYESDVAQQQITNDPALNSTKTTVSCNLCQAKISRNTSCLIAHAKVHLAYKPLKCEHCTFRHFAMSKIRRHNDKVHVNKPVKVSYHPIQDISKQLKDMKVKCFGYLAVSSSNAAQFVDQGETVLDEEGDSSTSTSPNDLATNDDVTALPVDSGVAKFGSSPPITSVSQLIKGFMNAGVSNSLLSPNCSINANALFASPDSKSSPNSVGRSDDMPYESSGLGRKLCKMCNTYIANNPSSFENHACKHLDYKPYNCNYCQYQSYIRGKVTRHIQQVHSGLPVKIIHKPIPGIKDQIQRVKLQCFPFLSGTLEVGGLTLEAMGAMIDEQNSKPSIATCKLCNNPVPTDDDSMSEHLQAHIMSKYYHCSVCTYQTTHLMRAKQHMNSAHDDDAEKRIVVCPPDGLQGLEALRISCFGEEDTLSEMQRRSNVFASKRGGDDSDDEEDLTDNKEVIDEDDDDDAPLPVSTGDEEMTEYISAVDNDDDRLKCVICGVDVLNQQTAMNAHARQHVDYKPYHCSFCNFKSTTESEVKHHILSTHRNAPPKVIYQPEKALLNKVQQKCFPTVSLIKVINGDGVENDCGSRGNSPTTSVVSSVAQGQGTPYATTQQSSSSLGSNMLRRLVCKLCSGTIADNPKSVGIHVKNHLNYKPYRCPYCRYMSCEQSKARRHVEHVHNVNGDAIEIHAEDNIKEKINEMKSRCFPNLGQLGLNDVYGNASPVVESGVNSEFSAPSIQPTRGTRVKSQLETYKCDVNEVASYCVRNDDVHGKNLRRCDVCKENVSLELLEQHARSHLSKPYKCAYCTLRFLSDDKVKRHIQTAHPYSPPKFVFQGAEIESQMTPMRKKCFPETNGDDAPDDHQLTKIQSSEFERRSRAQIGGVHSAQSTIKKVVTPVDGRLACLVCEQWVSMNPNSLDVHVKNHLEFKPHSCAYCSYKSCIAGKVKRHLESVHRGKETKVLSFSQSSVNLKQIIAEMRTACFPMVESDARQRTRAQVTHYVDQLRVRMIKELKVLSSVDTSGHNASRFNRGEVAEIFVDPDYEETGACPSSDQLENSLAEYDDENSNFMDTSGISNEGKLSCSICSTQIADNPSSLGLHVRNHLDYKPFHCNLCEYKSCIQAKVKRHLRNVHKCPTDQMSYNPLPNIRTKVTEMKIKCFPKMCEIEKTAFDDFAISGDEDFDEETDESNKTKYSWGKSGQNYLNNVLSSSLTDDASAFMDAGVEDEPMQEQGTFAPLESTASLDDIECQICNERLLSDHLSKTKHLTKHLGDFEYRCQYCEYASFVQQETLKHLTSMHIGQPVRVTRVSASGKQISAAYERLTDQCFPSELSMHGRTNKMRSSVKVETKDIKAASMNKTLVCALCDKEIENGDEAAIDEHVIEHKNRNHFKCAHCLFAHCQSSVVKEHCRSEHQDMAVKIMNMGADTKGDDDVWQTKCFPSISADAASLVNGVSAENEGSDDLEDDLDDDDDDLDDGTSIKKKSRNVSVDGPRYVCQICKSPVSMYASSLYVHVKNHMNYKPYCCGHCDYKSPVKSKVRRHIQNQHKNCQEVINYFPTPGIDHEVLRWKKKCFPEVTSFATLANDKVPCLLCKTDVADTLLSKSVHAKNHLDAKPYHCGYCSYKSCLRGETRRHVVRQHAGDPVNIQYIDAEIAQKEAVDEMIERCFVSGEAVLTEELQSTVKDEVADTSAEVQLDKKEPAIQETTEDEEKDEEDNEELENSPKPLEVKVERRKTSRQQLASPSSRTPPATSASSTISPSGYNLRTTRSSTIGLKNHNNNSTAQTNNNTNSHSTRNRANSSETAVKVSKDKGSKEDSSVKLGQAYREWFCCYCDFKAHSKYSVKQHCVGEHPGKTVEVSDQSRVNSKKV